MILGLKEREVHVAVFAVLKEVRMVGEIVVLGVLQDKESVLSQKVVLEDEVGQQRQFVECVGWVGVDEVELRLAGGNELEHIASDDCQVLRAELFAYADDIVLLRVRQFHSRHFRRSATHTFQTDAAGT